MCSRASPTGTTKSLGARWGQQRRDLVADAAIDLTDATRDHLCADTDAPDRWSLPAGARVVPSRWRATATGEGNPTRPPVASLETNVLCDLGREPEADTEITCGEC